MFLTHMLINLLSFGKGLHAHPAYMGLTSNAGQMVATFAFLNGSSATRAILDIMKFGPLPEKSFSAVLTVRAVLAVVIFDVTTWADASQA